MNTSLGRLLDTLAETVRTTDESPVARADAATALGHLGRALAGLRIDGVSSDPGDRREQQVAALATACTELGARAPSTEARLAELAAAAADTVAVLRGQATVGSRWAAATAMAETITPVTDLLSSGLHAGAAAQWLAEVRRQAALVQQTAALHPASHGDATLLDHPLPARTLIETADLATVVRDATAVLVHLTVATTEVPTIAEMLAYTAAAESLSGATEALTRITPTDAGDQVTAADAWRSIRAALQPFDDGSRRPHGYAPPAVLAAGRLHAALHGDAADPTSWSGPLRGAAVAAAQHLPTLARHLDGVVRSWGRTGALLAYAVDLPPREDRVTEHLRGHRPDGLVRADVFDLRPVTNAVRNARLLSIAVAAQAADPGGRMAADFPRRAWTAHRALLDHPRTPAVLSAARHQAYLRLQAARHRPTGARRVR